MEAEYLCGFQYPNLQMTPFGGQLGGEQGTALQSKLVEEKGGRKVNLESFFPPTFPASKWSKSAFVYRMSSEKVSQFGRLFKKIVISKLRDINGAPNVL